jgi:hypothetical protein
VVKAYNLAPPAKPMTDEAKKVLFGQTARV